jgi:hypothetical protein
MNRSSRFAISYSLSRTILHAISLARSGKEEAPSVIVVLGRQRQRSDASDFQRWHDKPKRSGKMKDLTELVTDNWPMFLIGALVLRLLVLVVVTPQ